MRRSVGERQFFAYAVACLRHQYGSVSGASTHQRGYRRGADRACFGVARDQHDAPFGSVQSQSRAQGHRQRIGQQCLRGQGERLTQITMSIEVAEDG